MLPPKMKGDASIVSTFDRFCLKKPKRKPLQLFNGDEIANFVIFKQ